MGGLSHGAYYTLKNGGGAALEQDKLTRISLLIGIFRALNQLYAQPLADEWIKLANTNPVFNGITPFDFMRRGGVPAMLRVRQLLAARLEGY